MAVPAPGRWRALCFLSLAEVGALALWFSAAAVLPALSREWQLGDGGRAGLTIAVQAGFIVGTFASALGNLPELFICIFALKSGLVDVVRAALVGSIFIQIGTNLANDYSDAKRGADTADRLGPVRVTSAGLRESHVHDVIITKEAPNYRLE